MESFKINDVEIRVEYFFGYNQKLDQAYKTSFGVTYMIQQMYLSVLDEVYHLPLEDILSIHHAGNKRDYFKISLGSTTESELNQMGFKIYGIFNLNNSTYTYTNCGMFKYDQDFIPTVLETAITYYEDLANWIEETENTCCTDEWVNKIHKILKTQFLTNKCISELYELPEAYEKLDYMISTKRSFDMAKALYFDHNTPAEFTKKLNKIEAKLKGDGKIISIKN